MRWIHPEQRNLSTDQIKRHRGCATHGPFGQPPGLAQAIDLVPCVQGQMVRGPAGPQTPREQSETGGKWRDYMQLDRPGHLFAIREPGL